MNRFIGFLTVVIAGAIFWARNPQLTPEILALLSMGGIVLGILIFLALACYGFQMLRLFFKI